MARERVSASSAMESEMAREDDLSALARERSDVVRAACVEASDSSKGVVEEEVGEEAGLGNGPGGET